MTGATNARGRPVGGGFARETDDFYPTPAWCTEALLDAVAFRGVTWEPACGTGAIMDVFEARGLPIVGTDLIDRGRGTGGIDFLLMSGSWVGDAPPANVVTNPPFKHAAEFCFQALAHATDKVAMLVKWNWLVAEGVRDRVRRRTLLEDPRCRRIIVLGRAAMLPPGAADNGMTPMIDFCWVVWEQAWTRGLDGTLVWAARGGR